MVLFCFLLVALIAFVSMAVDIGRVRLARTQLQTAADAAALAAARALQFLPQTDGIQQVQNLAIDTAEENVSIDQKNGIGARQDRDVTLVRDEDIEFGIWRVNALPGTQRFFPLENSGGLTDERREANAVRVWGRRCTTYETPDGQVITRNTGIPLIFAPILPNGPLAGDVQQQGTVMLRGGRRGYGFIGLDWVKFNGNTKTDSYNAGSETYPGVGGANDLGSIASNGNITLVGGTEIHGDVHPGMDASIQPYPLGSNVLVTGYMNPLEQPMTYAMPAFTLPQPPYNVSGTYDPPTVIKPDTSFQAANGQVITTLSSTANGNDVNGKPISTKFVFKSWTSGSQSTVKIKNDLSPVEFWISGDLKNSAQAQIHMTSNNFPVIFHCNGNFDMQGGGIYNDSATTPNLLKPENLQIYMCKSGTSLDVGGSPTMAAHIYAPGSAVKVHGNADGVYGFWGSIIGKTLDITGGSELHYDETFVPEPETFTTHLVD
jgi:hypothetical protein